MFFKTYSLFAGSGTEPVWKLQDPGFDQGYGSERSPEDDYVAPIVPQAVSLEEYEAELRTVYTFINDGKYLESVNICVGFISPDGGWQIYFIYI